MSSLSQFAGGSAPVGSIIQAPFNLTDPAWLPCDGRILNRADYPLLSACMPGVGVFTSTSRTRGVTPTGNALATNGAVWVMTGAIGTSNILTTPDGITYTPRGVPEFATDVRSFIHDGVNFVGLCGVGGSTSGVYSSDGGVTWAKFGSAGLVDTNATPCCMAHAPSLGAVGRFCLAAGAYDGNFYTSDDHGVTWVLRAHGVSGVKALHICWTGSRFFATTNVTKIGLISSDGVSWASINIPNSLTPLYAQSGSLVSDGNGRIVAIYGGNNAISISRDHGATWAVRRFSDVNGYFTSINQGSCTNGRFILSTDSNTAIVSTDLVAFSIKGIDTRGGTTCSFSYKAGVYYAASISAASDITAVEDVTKIQLPGGAQGPVTVSEISSWNNNMPWIKVK